MWGLLGGSGRGPGGDRDADETVATDGERRLEGSDVLGGVVGPEAGVDEPVDDVLQGRGEVVRVAASAVHDRQGEFDERRRLSAGRLQVLYRSDVGRCATSELDAW